MAKKKNIGVVFGGRSMEHDVSIVTGLQVLHELDKSSYNVFPIYIAMDGMWYSGNSLYDRGNYGSSMDSRRIKFTAPSPIIFNSVKDQQYSSGLGVSVRQEKELLFSRPAPLQLDCLLLALHGSYGENGCLQAFLEMQSIAYTGMRAGPSMIAMDKVKTKNYARTVGVDTLPSYLVSRNENGHQGGLINASVIDKAIKKLGGLPICAKPNNLGSSVGIFKIENLADLDRCAPKLFALDNEVILEPYLEDIVEYNIATRVENGSIELSAIESPKLASGDIFDFASKYRSASGNGGKKAGGKSAKFTALSAQLLSELRDFNPDHLGCHAARLREDAEKIFQIIGAAGMPRLDFILDKKADKLYFNEINPMPGSCAYYLWERAEKPFLFSDILSELIDEALAKNSMNHRNITDIPNYAKLFK